MRTLCFSVPQHRFLLPPLTMVRAEPRAELNVGLKFHDYASRIRHVTISGHPRTLVRLRPKLAAQHPSIPSDMWHPVLRYNPRALRPVAEPGLIWVDVEGRLRKLPTNYFEFTEAA